MDQTEEGHLSLGSVKKGSGNSRKYAKHALFARQISRDVNMIRGGVVNESTGIFLSLEAQFSLIHGA